MVASRAFALPATPYLTPPSGQQLSLLAFGDSITEGTGDTEHLGGYPGRLQAILNVPVTNSGVGGEALAHHGLTRLKSVVRQSSATTVILNEGNSDAYDFDISLPQFKAALVQAVGYIKRRNKQLLLATQYPELYLHSIVQGRLNGVNSIIRKVAAANGIRVVSIDRVWETTCNELPNCDLLFKDGLHPNGMGYDAITDVALAALAEINLFSTQGASEVEAAYDLPDNYVIVKP